VQARPPGIQRVKPLGGSEIEREDMPTLPPSACGCGSRVGGCRAVVGSFELFFSCVLGVRKACMLQNAFLACVTPPPHQQVRDGDATPNATKSYLSTVILCQNMDTPMRNQRNHFWFTPPFVVGTSAARLSTAHCSTASCPATRRRARCIVGISAAQNAAQLPRATTVRLNVVPIVEAQCSAW
jgi:hypothetical protein